MITNLQRLGVDTTGEKTMSLTYSDDVRKNYQSLFRLLRRLTTNYTFENDEFARLLAHMNLWEPSLSLVGKYRIPSPFDGETIKKPLGLQTRWRKNRLSSISRPLWCCIMARFSWSAYLVRDI
jgi:hypothetical protein